MNAYMKEIKETLKQIKKNHENLHSLAFAKDSCIAYFTYSISLAAYTDDEHMIIGHFHIKNIGNTSITQPVIFLQINSDLNIKFSGKFAEQKSVEISTIQEWERIQSDEYSDGEYCFQPLHANDIPPGESLSFSDFQIRFPATDTSSLSVQGFVYFRENQEGMNALNMINITM